MRINYEFEDIRPEEEEMVNYIIWQIMEEPHDVHKHLAEANKRGLKCAYVLYLPPDEEKMDFVIEEAGALEMFPLEQVKFALDFHDYGEDVCLIFVRDNKVAVAVEPIIE